MGRNQTGRIYEASKAFYVQYRTNEIVNGEPKRVQRSLFLCNKDANLCYSKKAKEVTRLCREVMAKVNAQQSRSNGHATQQDMRVADFWEQRFLPYSEEIIQTGERTGQPRKRTSTIRGYKQIWRQHLQSHFGNKTLQQYNDPHQGNDFLDSLTSTQNKNTLKHIKALATALFSYAVKKRIISVNPWHEIRIPEDAIEPKPTRHYSLAEAQNLVSALVDHVDCQLILAFSCFLGLRPGEIAALRWEDFDFDAGTVHIQRSVVRGVVGTPKTAESNAEIPLITPVAVPLKLWHDKDNPTHGYVFKSKRGTPVDLHNVVSRVIIPHVNGGRHCVLCNVVPAAASGLTWKGLYSGRRGACTITIEASKGNYAVAQALLRHKHMTTTLNVYKKAITPEAFHAGMKLLEAAAESAANGKK